MAKVRLRRVSVLAVAFWHGLYSLIFAIFLGVTYSGYTYISYGRLPTYNLLYYMVGIPVVYCPLGFLAYGLAAAIYNSLAQSMGGITLEFDNSDDVLPPPPSY
jgi:hypothetical protein